MRKLNIILVISLYILIAILTYNIIINYFVRHDWNYNIHHLGDEYIRRCLMSTHYIGGIVLMLFYPLQIMIRKKSLNIHILLGIILVLISIVTSLAGMIYIVMYGTIGGPIMSVSFFVLGMLLLCFSILTILTNGINKNNLNINTIDQLNYDNIDLEQYKDNKYHKKIIILYGSLIYSSLFYRVLYIISLKFGYDIPLTKELYNRPLDIFFQLGFFTIPLGLAVLYIYVKQLRDAIKYLSFYIIFVAVVMSMF